MTWTADLAELAEKATGVMFRFEDGGFAVCDPERVRVLCELAEAARQFISAEDEWHLRHGMGRQRVPYRAEMDFRNKWMRDTLAALASLEPAREEET